MNIGIVFIVFCFIVIIIIALFGLLKNLKLTPISDWCKHVAVIYDDSGRFIGEVRVKYTDKVFKFNEFLYNFFPNESSFFKHGFIFNSIKFYSYSLNCPDPLIMKKGTAEPVIDSKVYKSVFENKLIEDLNNLAESPLLIFIKKYWWILLVIIAVAVYFFSKAQAGGDVVNTAVNNSASIVNERITIIK